MATRGEAMKEANLVWNLIWLLTGALPGSLVSHRAPVAGRSLAVLTGWLVWRLLGRRNMVATLISVVIWAAMLAFAQSELGLALIQSRQPLTVKQVPRVPDCNESPPVGGQDRKTWVFQCSG